MAPLSLSLCQNCPVHVARCLGLFLLLGASAHIPYSGLVLMGVVTREGIALSWGWVVGLEEDGAVPVRSQSSVCPAPSGSSAQPQ